MTAGEEEEWWKSSLCCFCLLCCSLACLAFSLVSWSMRRDLPGRLDHPASVWLFFW